MIKNAYVVIMIFVLNHNVLCLHHSIKQLSFKQVQQDVFLEIVSHIWTTTSDTAHIVSLMQTEKACFETLNSTENMNKLIRLLAQKKHEHPLLIASLVGTNAARKILMNEMPSGYKKLIKKLFSNNIHNFDQGVKNCARMGVFDVNYEDAKNAVLKQMMLYFCSKEKRKKLFGHNHNKDEQSLFQIDCCNRLRLFTLFLSGVQFKIDNESQIYRYALDLLKIKNNKMFNRCELWIELPERAYERNVFFEEDLFAFLINSLPRSTWVLERLNDGHFSLLYNAVTYNDLPAVQALLAFIDSGPYSIEEKRKVLQPAIINARMKNQWDMMRCFEKILSKAG